MKKPLTAFALVATAAVALLIPPPAICQSGCGLLPLKPLVPLGCRDLKPECVCDSRGKNCEWVWKCVK